jgi:hypothetical protein
VPARFRCCAPQGRQPGKHPSNGGFDGKVVHVTDAMNPQTHFDEMKEAIASLKK